MNRIYIYVIILALLLISCNCNQEKKELSLYYLDTVSLSSFDVTCYDSIWSELKDLRFKNGYIYLNHPLALSPKHVHTKLYIKYQGKTDTISLNIRCWKDNEYRLKEVNKSYNIINKIERYYYNHFKDSTEFNKHFFNPVLLRSDGNILHVNNGVLLKSNTEGITSTLATIKINDAMYNQMIASGSFGIIRSGHTIVLSDDSLRSWKQIYYGPRQIKESMIWNDKDSSLLFAQYTPGKVRNRHYVLKYNYTRDNIDTVFTFYTEKEFKEKGLYPCARHIHVMTIDPYSGWIFLGTGDSDNESAIYVSKNFGKKFEKIGGGTQVWRTLSFIFTKDYIFWNTDSDAPQYLTRISRHDLNKLPLAQESIIRFPLFNSALWNTIQYGNMTLMSSNIEGALYDNKRRIYGITFNESGIPTVYNLWEENGDRWSSQLFPIGIDEEGRFQFYDTQNLKYRYFILVDRHGKRI